jgi:hypothetical protein
MTSVLYGMARYRITYLVRCGDQFTTHELTTTTYGEWAEPLAQFKEAYDGIWGTEGEYERAVLEVEKLQLWP